jgi:hypothetical protein
MSAELLEAIKQQAESLTPEEKAQLLQHLLQQVDAPARTQPARRDDTDKSMRQRRLEWLKTHREEYAGQYVALHGEKLVGHGATIGEAHEQARLKGVQHPFLVRVTSESEVLFGGW